MTMSVPPHTRLAVVEADPAGRPLQLFLTYRLASLHARLNRQAGILLKRAGGLKIPEWRIIALLATYGAMTGRRIGDIAGLDAGLVSRTFRALETRGLLTLQRGAGDRRLAHASLTPAGQALFSTVRPVMAARQERLLDALSAEERAMVFLIIDKLATAAEDVSMPGTML